MPCCRSGVNAGCPHPLTRVTLVSRVPEAQAPGSLHGSLVDTQPGLPPPPPQLRFLGRLPKKFLDFLSQHLLLRSPTSGSRWLLMNVVTMTSIQETQRMHLKQILFIAGGILPGPHESGGDCCFHISVGTTLWLRLRRDIENETLYYSCNHFNTLSPKVGLRVPQNVFTGEVHIWTQGCVCPDWPLASPAPGTMAEFTLPPGLLPAHSSDGERWVQQHGSTFLPHLCALCCQPLSHLGPQRDPKSNSCCS